MKKVFLAACAALLATSLFAAKPKAIKVGSINNDPNESG